MKIRLPELAQIAEDQGYKAALAELTALERRLAETERRRQRAQARLRGAKPAPLERAKKLVDGGQIGTADPVDDLKAADSEEFEVLRLAIREATALLDEISGDLSFAACQKLRPHYAQAVKSALQAMETLAEALDAMGAVRATLRAAGYQPLDTVLPSAVPPAAIALGSPSAVGNSQSFFGDK